MSVTSGDNSGAEPPELDTRPHCDGTGLEPDGESGEPCNRCDGDGVIYPDPDDYDEPWPALDEVW